MKTSKTITENKVLAYLAFLLILFATLTSVAEAKNQKSTQNESSAENIDITQADVKYAKQKVRLGITTLNNYWQANFTQNGLRYNAPNVYYYYRPTRTSCGVVQMKNAVYCVRNNSIYFDLYFFTRMMKAVGNRFGTDGDMAIITVLAHEWGHAVQAQTKNFWHLPVLNELGADCFAGAFVGNASRLGYIESGDDKEAMLTLAMGGDNAPWYSPEAHGNSKQRMSNFNKGFRQGLNPCVAR